MLRQERASLVQRNVESLWLRESEIEWLRAKKEAGADHMGTFLSQHLSSLSFKMSCSDHY